MDSVSILSMDCPLTSGGRKKKKSGQEIPYFLPDARPYWILVIRIHLFHPQTKETISLHFFVFFIWK